MVGNWKSSFPRPRYQWSQIDYFEPECATVGSNWNIIEDAQVSGGKYVTVRPDTQSVSGNDHLVCTEVA